MNLASWESGASTGVRDAPAPEEVGHWSYPVVNPLRPPHEILALAETAGSAGPVGLLEGEVWSGTATQADFLNRVLRAHLARRARKGPPGRDLSSDERAPVAGTKIEMRADAAAAAGRLLAAAQDALAAARVRGDEDAARTTRLTATSGYRDAGHQERLWRGYFGRYYNESAAGRERLAGGPHSDEAVRYMLDVFRIPARIAAPGYSNHQNGIAIDLLQERTAGHRIRNSTQAEAVRAWRRTWFFHWLQANAGSFGFAPYEREPWHWEYRPARASGREFESVDRFGTAGPDQYEDEDAYEDVEEAEDGAYEEPGALEEYEEPPAYEEPDEWEEWEEYEQEWEDDLEAETAALGEEFLDETSDDLPAGPLGTLCLDRPGGRGWSYTFTPEDVLWTAKLVALEAGGTDDAKNAAVIWAMLNRYALITHRSKRYPTFTSFIRAYSTTLQPVLLNKGAAAAHMHERDFHRTGGTYEGTTIPKGQLGRHLRTQAEPWRDIRPASAKDLALRALTGRLPNPGIGNASEFASTRIFWQRRHRTRKEPTPQEWRDYTEAYALRRDLRWIGDVPGLPQRANAFFLHRVGRKYPPGAVRVSPPFGG